MNNVRWSVARFYEAIRSQDLDELRGSVSPDVVVHVTEGIPFIGGRWEGFDTVLRNVWWPATSRFGVAPRPIETIPIGARRVVVFGVYEGIVPSTGRSINAAFVHDVRHDGERITELRQVTDSEAWVSALRPAGERGRQRRDIADGHLRAAHPNLPAAGLSRSTSAG